MRRKGLLWIVGLGILGGFIFFADWTEVVEALSYVDGWILVALFGVQLLTLCLITYQWKYILDCSDIDLPYREIFAVNLAGTFVESVTPSSKLGGEAAKVYLFERLSSANYLDLSSAVAVHKFVSMVPFLALCLTITGAAVLFLDGRIPGTTTVALILIAVAGGLSLGLLLVRKNGRITTRRTGRRSLPVSISIFDRLPGRIERLGTRAITVLRETTRGAKRLTTPADRRHLYLVSLVIWGLYPLKVYVVAVMLGLDAGLLLATIGTILAYLVSITPLSPGGTGTFEGTLALVFLAGGSTFAEGLTVALVARLVTFWFPLALSVAATIWLLFSDHHIQPDEIGLGRFGNIFDNH